MTKLRLINEAITLAGSTEARLFGTDSYAEIAEARARWVAWIDRQPPGYEADSWQDCFRDWKRSMEKLRPG